MRSKAEAVYVTAIKKIIPWAEYEPCRFEWTDDKVHRYTPDLYLGIALDGKPVYLELKGVPSYLEVNKIRCVTRCNPQIHLWVLIYRDSKTPNGSMWSQVYKDAGIPTCVGRLPDGWIKSIKEVAPDTTMQPVKVTYVPRRTPIRKRT